MSGDDRNSSPRERPELDTAVVGTVGGCGSSTGSSRTPRRTTFRWRCGWTARWTSTRCSRRCATWSPDTRCCAPSTRNPDGASQVILAPPDVAVELAPLSRCRMRNCPVVVDGLVRTTFDVTREVPMRAALYRVSRGASRACLRGAPYLRRRFVPRPAGTRCDVRLSRAGGREAPAWSLLPVQYADYALWQRELLGSEDDPDPRSRDSSGTGSVSCPACPTFWSCPRIAHVRPVQSFAGARVAFDVDAELHRRLTELARAHNCTLFMVVHTAFAVLLARLSGTGDIAVGTPIAGRGERVLDELIGMFVNTLVFRTHVDAGEPFDALLTRVRESDLTAFANADVPFERLVEVLNPPAPRRGIRCSRSVSPSRTCVRRGWSCPGSRCRRSRWTPGTLNSICI